MNFYELLPLLPVVYKDNSMNLRMLEKIKKICEGSTERALYILEKFSNILEKEFFDIAYQEHQRIMTLTLKKAREIPEEIDHKRKDKIFADIACSVFDSRLGVLAINNNHAFRIFLSLLRRKHNIEEDEKYKRDLAEMNKNARAKQRGQRGRGGQGRLFH